MKKERNQKWIEEKREVIMESKSYFERLKREESIDRDMNFWVWLTEDCREDCVTNHKLIDVDLDLTIEEQIAELKNIFKNEI